MTREDFRTKYGETALQKLDKLHALFGRAMNTRDMRKYRRYINVRRRMERRLNLDLGKVNSI